MLLINEKEKDIIFEYYDSITGKGLGAKQFAWLKDDLKNTDKDIIFVIMHKSLFSTGSHANDKEVAKMRGINVDALN